MRRFEYKYESGRFKNDYEIKNNFENMGASGWELVWFNAIINEDSSAFSYHRYYAMFKKEV